MLYVQDEKMAWADSVKREGNDLYAKRMFKEAMEKYTEALTAADFGNKTRLATQCID